MRLQHVIEKVYNSPLCITQGAFQSIDRVIQSKLAGIPLEFDAPEEEESNVRIVNVDGKNIAIQTLEGVVGYRVSAIERACGVIDTGVEKAVFNELQNSERIDGIILDISSGGGTVTGVPEFADAIRNASKPVVAFTDTMMASAAYWIGSAANNIATTPTGEVGSIGVYSAILDTSRQYAQEGVEVKLVKAGEFKAEGMSGIPVAQETLDRMQAEVDKIYETFKAAVRERRKVEDGAMQGQMFSSDDAIENGLSDLVVNDLDDLVLAFASAL